MIDFLALLPFSPHRDACLQRPRRLRASRRPVLETLEGRLVLSHMMPAPQVQAAAQVQILAARAPRINLPVQLTGLNITEITRDATTGVLNLVGTATGTILGQSFTTDLTGSITPGRNARRCPVLNLNLQPISLSVLGLNVDTSAICLNINAQKGGGLLGNLLCGGLTDVLGTATSGTTEALGEATGQLNGLLSQPRALRVANQALRQAATRVSSLTPAQENSCPILDLAVGPVRLNLLGLRVKLDNCANGPVQVRVTATQGQLLGDLLCGLNTGLTGRRLLRSINSVLGSITNTVA